MATLTEITENEYVKERSHLSKGIIIYDQYCAITGKRCGTECSLVLSTNWKSHMGFRLVLNQWPWMILNGVKTADARYLCGSWASC